MYPYLESVNLGGLVADHLQREQARAKTSTSVIHDARQPKTVPAAA